MLKLGKVGVARTGIFDSGVLGLVLVSDISTAVSILRSAGAREDDVMVSPGVGVVTEERPPFFFPFLFFLAGILARWVSRILRDA